MTVYVIIIIWFFFICNRNVTARYQDLAKYLFVKYLDGNRKKEKDGKFLRLSSQQ